jgi:hypothetical protein
LNRKVSRDRRRDYIVFWRGYGEEFALLAVIPLIFHQLHPIAPLTVQSPSGKPARSGGKQR